MTPQEELHGIKAGDTKAVVGLAVRMVRDGERIGFELYESMAEKAGDNFVAALNEAMAKAGLE